MSRFKTALYNGGNLNGFAMQPGAGTVFYVDGTNGSNSNDGLTPATAFDTITYAITQATANANDYIVALLVDNAAETFPIAVNKAKVHIFGSSSDQGVGRTITPPDDTAAFYITADKVEIAGFDMSAGATHACIETNTGAQTWGPWIHHCSFGWMGTAQDGIRFPPSHDVPHAMVHDNRFNSGIARDGIRISQNSTRGEFFNNQFRLVGGIGIDFQSGCTDIYSVHDNVFEVADGATGEAITCCAASTGCMFYNNQAFQGVVQTTNVPFRDLGSNHWGLNYYSIIAIEPVTV